MNTIPSARDGAASVAPQGIGRIASYEMPRRPVQNRVAWRPTPERAALLVHDMQDYFLHKFDRAAAPVPELVKNARRLRDICDELHVPVFYTAQPSDQPSGDRALLNDFWGPGLSDPLYHSRQPIIDELSPREDDVVLTKWRYSAFQRSDLREQLRARGRDQLILCGIYAHIGVMATALEAFMQDVQAFLVIDAVADFSEADHMMAVDYVSRRCGVSLTLDEVTRSLLP